MNLALGFSESPDQLGIARRNESIETSVARFEQWMAVPDSPIRAIRHQPAREGEYAEIPASVAPALREALIARGIPKLYVHQSDAFERSAAGQNVVVVTPTASGKTLCYNLPVLQRLIDDPGARAMYLFPTKALAEDQLHEFQAAVDAMGSQIRAFTYDGDTPQDARRAIRERANVVLTNPDMLHSGILPHHTKWAKCFENLRYVVIDELHYYRGVYGSHLANLLRRLRRICEFYGSSPQFICCSATIANPKELAQALTESPFELVDRNGAPSGEKYFVFYNPPVVNKQLGIRRGYLQETRRIAIEFIERHQQTLVFANSRLATEILVKYLRDAIERGPLPGDAVRGYRGGYLPRERREIERKLRDGEIRSQGGGDECAGTGSRHWIAGCSGDGGIPGIHRVVVAEGRAGRTAPERVDRGAGGIQRTSRSIRGGASGVLLRRIPRTRTHQRGQSGDSDQSFEVRGI